VRFAVPRPGIPVASPRSHGVPRRDVPCRVDVSIAGITAGGAPEGGLALARLPVHLPARRAHLACVRGVDLFDSAGSLLLQATDQQAPSRPHNASIKSGLLADVAAWVFPCASGGLRHVPDLETFYPDQVKPAGNVRTGLFGPILSPICVAGAQPGDRMLHPCAAVRLGPCAGQLPLQPPQPLPHRGSEADRVQQFSCRQRRRHRHTSVDPHGLPVTGSWDRAWNERKADMPAPGMIHSYPVRLRARRHGAGPAEPHPPCLRDADLADTAGQAAYFPVLPAPAHDPESLIPASLAPRRPPRRIPRIEEESQGAREISQRLLLHRLTSCGQPIMLGPCLGELPTLLQIAGSAPAARPPVSMLLNGEVPHVAGMGAVIAQHRFLGGRGQQAIPRHTNTLTIATDISREVKRRTLPALEGRFPAPRFS
jgi:hypothetical protein